MVMERDMLSRRLDDLHMQHAGLDDNLRNLKKELESLAEKKEHMEIMERLEQEVYHDEEM